VIKPVSAFLVFLALLIYSTCRLTPWRKRKEIKEDAGVGSMVRGRGPHVEMWPGASNNL